MKKTVLRLTAAVLLLAMLVMPVSAAGAKNVLETSQTLADHTELIHGTWQLGSGSTYLQENYIVYEPEKAVKPMVVFGDTLYGRSDMKYVSSYLAKQDLAMVAAINGAFFDFDSGIPYGLVVTDGILRSSGNTASVGFFNDGSAILGEPGLAVSFETGDGDESELFYNKMLTKSNGFGLYSKDFDTKTKNTIPAYNIILRPTNEADAELTMQCEIETEVTGVIADTASCAIPDDCFVLSLASDSSYQSAINRIKSMEIGDTVIIRTECDKAWRNVDSACGGGEMLVEDGEALSSFTLDSARESRARTAIGLKKDGTMVLYTVDASTNSAGLKLSELAGRLKELGCETALNLDGGGSTAVGVQYPGYSTGATANTPEDGSLRACANYIFLVREAGLARSAEKLFLYPCSGTPVLPGARLAITVKATDDDYMAAEVPENVSFVAAGGTITDSGVLTVDNDAEELVTVTVSSDLGKVTNLYKVLEEVTGITVSEKGSSKAVGKLTVAAKSTVDFKAAATYCGAAVQADNASFDWDVSEKLGKVNSNGTFTAADVTDAVTGTLTVSFGSTKAVVELTVSPENPFADTKGHWSEKYCNALYFNGTLTGSTGKDGKLYYRPDASMTRQEFIVALMRFLGVDAAQYNSASLPFADSGKIAAWALDAMKAAYKLGYMSGSSSGGKLYANPTSTISRQEAMVILARTQGLTEAAKKTILTQFSDSAKVAKWAEGPLSAMVEKGIISGSNGKLDPTGNVSRGQVAKMLYMMMDGE